MSGVRQAEVDHEDTLKDRQSELNNLVREQQIEYGDTRGSVAVQSRRRMKRYERVCCL